VAEVSGFSEFLQFMAGADAFTLLLPFLLSWIVYYLALDKAEFLFGDSDLENMPPVLALIMAFFTARFIVLNPYYQQFFITYFGKITIGVIGILGLFTMLAFVGYEKTVINRGAFVVFVLMAVGAAFLSAGGFGPPIIEGIGLSQAAAVGMSLVNWSLETGAIWAVVIGTVVWLIVKEPSEDGNDDSMGVGLLDWLINADTSELRNNPDE